MPLSSGFFLTGFDLPLLTGLTIRRYEPRDADAVWDLHERALRESTPVGEMPVYAKPL